MTEAATRTLAEIQPVVGAKSTTIDNWIVRLKKNELLATEYAPSVQGRERVFTRANTLELAIIGAFVRSGVAPKKAAVYGAHVIRSVNYPYGQDPSRREWIVFAAGDIRKTIGTDNPDLDALAKKFSADALSLVRVGEIIRRVDTLFADEA
jgi:hypothetical protein